MLRLPTAGIVISVGRQTAYTFAAFFHLVPDVRPLALLALAPVVGVEDGTLRLGPLALFDGLDAGSVLMPDDDGEIVYVASEPLPGLQALSIARILAMLDFKSTTAWLPLRYAFDGDEASRDPQTGELVQDEELAEAA